MVKSELSFRTSDARYVLLAICVGVGAGSIGSVFHLAIDWSLQWPQWLATHIDGALLVVAAALITMVCTVAAVFVVQKIAPEAGGSGVQEIEGAMEGLREVRWQRVLPVKFFAGLASIGAGLVLGREGPTIHIGASVAEGVAERAKASDLQRRGLLAAGAAAGLACAFNAPLAAVLFVIEETRKQFPYTFNTYMGVIAAAIMSTVMTEVIGGVAPDLALSVPQIPLALLGHFVLLGAFLGALGVLLNRAILTMVDAAHRWQIRIPYVYPAIVGLVVGATVILQPWAVTGGETVIKEVVAAHPGIAVMLLLGVARFVTMVASYSTGVPGGIFAPILALAASFGLAFGEIAAAITPGLDIPPLAFAICAMGGLFTSSVRAPVVGMVLILELTGAYDVTLALMITCLTANLVAQWLGGKPIYEQLLDRTLALAGITRKEPAKEPTGLA
mgnify:CR=1 FL=1